jgi:hypothetical protein
MWEELFFAGKPFSSTRNLSQVKYSDQRREEDVHQLLGSTDVVKDLIQLIILHAKYFYIFIFDIYKFFNQVDPPSLTLRNHVVLYGINII